MRRSRLAWLYLVVLAAVAGSGCTGHCHYRTTPAALGLGSSAARELCAVRDGDPTARASFVERADYAVGFVELDDLGWFWDRAQKDHVVAEVARLAATDDLLLVTFAHGWNHNASAEDGNVQSFEEVLGLMAKLEQKAAAAKCQTPRKVVGVYLGWRGKAFHRPNGFPAVLYNWASFWSRKATAHRVGSEDAAELLTRLEDIRSDRLAAHPGAPRPTRLIVTGHSFGTAVVYGALSRILAERRTWLEDTGTEAADFGDLVVLVNPAIEASLLFPFEKAGASYTAVGGQARQAAAAAPFHPILAVFTSQGDSATRVLFRFGRSVSTLFKRHRRTNPPGFSSPADFQGVAARTAVGHFEPTVTHVLCPAGEQPGGADGRRCVGSQERSLRYGNEESGRCLDQNPQQVARLLESLAAGQAQVPAVVAGEDRELGLSTGSLWSRRAGPMTPYPIVSVDARLIKDHNDIFTCWFAPFLLEFVSVWSPPIPTSCPAS